ncbi:MAG: DUF1850 domain-containing protein, partial [Synergistaceae bacterium]|nr:DUF1850 domain-containing protein [Synergistaceae bacterium]
LIDKNLPDDVVYDLLENIYSPAGLEAIQSAHATAKANISLETALRGIAGTSIPLHDGALQFYRDKGIDTSPSLSLRIYDWKTEELYISKPARADSELFFGWVHSLEKIPWNEYYHVDKDLRIVLDAVTFPAFGAGIPENKGGTCYVENGLIHMEEIDQPFTELVWLNSCTATQEIRLDGEYVTRGSELPHHARLRLVFERG